MLESGNASILAFVRQHEEETLIVFINPGGKATEELTFTVPEGISGSTTDLFSGEASVTINEDGTFTLGVLKVRSWAIVQVDDE